MSFGDTLLRYFGGGDLARNELNSTFTAVRFRRYFDAAIHASRASQRAVRGCSSMGDALKAYSGGVAC